VGIALASSARASEHENRDGIPSQSEIKNLKYKIGLLWLITKTITRPRPLLAKTYWDSVKADVMQMQLCDACNKFVFCPRNVCPEDRLFKRPFFFPMAPRTRQNTAADALESVLGVGCDLLSVDSAAEMLPSWASCVGYR
jgi:hypothetical protein